MTLLPKRFRLGTFSNQKMSSHQSMFLPLFIFSFIFLFLDTPSASFTSFIIPSIFQFPCFALFPDSHQLYNGKHSARGRNKISVYYTVNDCQLITGCRNETNIRLFVEEAWSTRRPRPTSSLSQLSRKGKRTGRNLRHFSVKI